MVGEKKMKKYKGTNCEILNNSNLNFTYKAICPYCGKIEKPRKITCQILPIKSQSIKLVKCDNCGNLYDVFLEEIEN